MSYIYRKIKKLFIILVLIISILSLTFISYSAYLIKYKYRNTRVIMVTGGLGNQLYQVAFGYALHKKTGMNVKYDTIILDEEVKKQKNRTWVRWYFDKLDVKAEKWKANFIEQFIIRTLHSARVKQEDCNKFSHDYDERCFDKNIGIYMKKQFFGNPKYFIDYEKDIQRMFTTLSDEHKHELDDKNIAMIKDMQSHKNSVVVNIRLGDFLKYKWHNICNFDYYKRAMKVFEKMEDVHYYIFSDDIEGAKKYFKIDKPHTFVDINPLEKPYLNLILSSSAKHNIISNSTFAIWAGMLNKNPNKIVVCPHLFFRPYVYGPIGEQTFKEAKNIYPADWIKINVDNDEPIDKNNINTKLNDYLGK